MSAKWKYGDAGDRYPIRPGSVWAVGDSAFFACGDIEAGDGEKLWAGQVPPSPDLVYCDPPWTPALATGFRTKAGLPRKVAFVDEFLPALALEVTRAPIAAIECGRDHVDDLAEAVERSGHLVIRDYEITYYRKKPARLIVTGNPKGVAFTDDLVRANSLDLNGVDDANTPRAFLEHFAPLGGRLVYDPCMGRGLTAVAAHATGNAVVGLELSDRRLAVTVSKLVALGAGRARRIGDL